MSAKVFCQGYAIWHDDGTETLYAHVDNGGGFWKSDTHKRSTHFDTKTRKWERVSEFPNAVEFIGRYPIETNKRP